MGSLILCHSKKAKQPYEIARIRRKVYTIEELCYYLCNNLYLIDYTIMNVQLCDWLHEELGFTELAEHLRESLLCHGSMEQFVLSILEASNIYTTIEITHIQNVLERLRNQNDTERKKFKADNLLESGEVEAAVLIYREMIHGERDESVDSKFYGKVYACLGGAYGRMFLYEEAADMYEAAFQIGEEEGLLRAYLYCCYRYMERETYQQLVKKSNVFELIDNLLQQELKNSIEMMPVSVPCEQLDIWKNEYRSGHL